MNILKRFRSPQLRANRRGAAVACGVFASGLLVLGALLAPSAEAQTVAVGPYYATPAWDQTFPCTALANCPRFVVLSNFASNAVLDRETGLVWERSPSLTGVNYFFAHERCLNLDTGGRKGWRVPGIQEMMSLIDPSVSSAPRLPVGHPFTDMTAATPFYMTATLSTDRSEGVWAVNLNLGINNFFSDRRLNFVRVWCVRGGQGNPAQ
jgi:hypothetical protein